MGAPDSGEAARLESLQSQLAQATAAAYSAYRDTARLIRLLTVLGKPVAPDQLVDEVLRVLSSAFDAGVVCMARRSGDELVVSRACGLSEDAPAVVDGWRLGAAASGAVASGRPIARVASEFGSGDLPPELAKLEIRSAAWVPLTTGGPARDLIILFRSAAEGFSGADLKLLETVAYRLSLSLESGERQLTVERLARIGHKLVRHLETDALLADAAELFAGLTKADSVAIFTVEADRLAIGAVFHVAEQEVSWWLDAVEALPDWPQLRAGRAVVHDDLFMDGGSLTAPGRAYLGVPVVSQSRTIAVLAAFHHLPGAFNDDAAEVATIFASYVAAAMVNAELYLALAHSASQLRLMTDSISDMIALVDREGLFRYASPSHEREVGRDPDELLGRSCLDLVHPNDRAAMRRGFAKVDESPKVEYRVLSGTGEWVWVESALRRGPIEDTDIVLSSRVITDRKNLESELWRRATHDTMTGLANRDLMRQRLESALAADAAGSVGILFCDLDNFKSVNDRLGHEAGDILLRQVADRLRECVRPSDLLARLGGDEFLVVIDGVAGLDDVRRVGERLLAALGPAFELPGDTVSISASIGGVLGPRRRARAVALLRDADAAMYAAKTSGGGRVAVFDDAAARQSLDRLSLRSEISRALDNHELSLMYQPVVSLDTCAIVGFEALLRWTSPTRGPISPVSFIPAAEETGAIIPIGRWVLSEACRQLAAWRSDLAVSSLTMAVNVSGPQLTNPDFVEETIDAARSAGLTPRDVYLEVTENRSVPDEALDAVRTLRAEGFRWALDDFGIFHSNLSYLQRFPVDVLKIDRSFVAGITNDGVDKGIVHAILALTTSLRLDVIAEGVETRAQWRELLAAGCARAQGFFFAKPLTPDDAAELLRTGIRVGPHGTVQEFNAASGAAIRRPSPRRARVTRVTRLAAARPTGTENSTRH